MGLYDQKLNKMLKSQAPFVISPFSKWSIGTELAAMGVSFSSVAAVFNAVIMFCPFYLPAPATLHKFSLANGDVVSGNVDVGIYNEDFGRLISTGNTAQSGTDSLQIFDVADTYLPAGRYYLALGADNVTGKAESVGLTGMIAGGLQLRGLTGALTQNANPLPATATPDGAADRIWAVAAHFRSVID